MKKYWDEKFGDRRQEIVFIGIRNEMNQKIIYEQLDNCLIDKYQFGSDIYKNIKDPFPLWFQDT